MPRIEFLMSCNVQSHVLHPTLQDRLPNHVATISIVASVRGQERTETVSAELREPAAKLLERVCAMLALQPEKHCLKVCAPATCVIVLTCAMTRAHVPLLCACHPFAT